ncbi:MAG: glycosyltransferase family 4 protein [Anaerolineales bacterium]
MHVLIVNSEYPPIGGGAGNASAHLARQLVKMGHQVTVLTARFARLPREEIEEGVRVLRLPAARTKADRSTAFEQTVFMFSAAILGLFWVGRKRPQVALAFFGVPSGAVVWFWNWFVRLPYVVCLRGGDVPGFRPYDFARQHRLLGPLLRHVWRRAAAVVANSEGLRQLAHQFESNVPIQVIPNGAELENYKVEGRKWQPTRLLFVGRIVYQKGLDLLLNALGNLKNLDWQLDLAGDGPRLEKLREHAIQLGLGERVHFLGWQSKAELLQIYRQANLFVYPSRHEGMPNAVLEAMASGLPVLASRIAGNEELVTPETGMLFPTEDVAALQTALKEMLLDVRVRQQMGVAGRSRVEENYSWSSVAEDYLQLMQKVVAAK